MMERRDEHERAKPVAADPPPDSVNHQDATSAAALAAAETARLVRAAQAGDTVAMNDLLDRLAPFVGRICGPIALDNAEDAAQETLIVIFRQLRTLREPAALYGWARSIAAHEAVRVAQRAKARAGSAELPEIADPRDATLMVDIQDVLSRLNPEQRAILVLRDLEGMDEQEASALLQVQRGTVKSRLHRARASFRGRWGPES